MEALPSCRQFMHSQNPAIGQRSALPPGYQGQPDSQRHAQQASSSSSNFGRNSDEAPLLPFKTQKRRQYTRPARRQQTPVPQDGEEDWVTTDSGSSSEYQDADESSTSTESDTEPERPRDKRRVEIDKGGNKLRSKTAKMNKFHNRRRGRGSM